MSEKCFVSYIPNIPSINKKCILPTALLEQGTYKAKCRILLDIIFKPFMII
jgi:hypothetical protein